MRFLKKGVSLVTACVLASSLMMTNVSALENHLNIEVYMDKSYVTRNGQPTAWTTKYESLTEAVGYMYNLMAGIDLDFNFTLDSYHLITSTADSCTNKNDDGTCNHCSYLYCSNEGPYHHNNGIYLRDSVSTLSSLYTAVLILTSTPMCSASNYSHGTILGVANKGKSRISVYEHDVKTELAKDFVHSTRATIAHEIGHLYGVADHYNIEYGDERDNCIYGANKNEKSIRNGMKMCSTCQETIKANKSLYNQS